MAPYMDLQITKSTYRYYSTLSSSQYSFVANDFVFVVSLHFGFVHVVDHSYRQ